MLDELCPDPRFQDLVRRIGWRPRIWIRPPKEKAWVCSPAAGKRCLAGSARRSKFEIRLRLQELETEIAKVELDLELISRQLAQRR